MRFFAWLFPQTEPIVVSRILRVFGSSGHQLGIKDMQNKQGTNGGVSASSPMLKLDREIESANVSLAVVYFSHTFMLLFLPYL